MSVATKRRTPRRNRKAKAGGGPGPSRVTKKSGDVRSKPDRGKTVTGEGPGPLSGKMIRRLRALGHHLTPVVHVGKEGVTDAIIAATREQLLAHELVKVKIGTEAPTSRTEIGPDLAAKTGATLAQTLGRTLLLYKRHPNKPKIELSA